MSSSSTGSDAADRATAIRPAAGRGRRRTMSIALVICCVLLIGCQPGSATPGTTAGQVATLAATPSGGPSAAPTTPTAAIAQITFNSMELDALSDPMAQSRTFTFISDGPGPVSVAIAKTKNPTDLTSLCLSVDGGAMGCVSGKTPSMVVEATKPQSSCTVQVISAGNATPPVVDISISWPAKNPAIKLEHGRLQGSSSPGVDEELNGFNFTLNPRGSGNLTVSAKWTTILTYIDVALFDATAMPWVNLDERQYQGGGSGVAGINPAYTHAVDHSKTYRFSLRDTQADNYRPDLSAEISFP